SWQRPAARSCLVVLTCCVCSSLPRVSVDLTPDSFRSLVLSGQDHWVLDFYAPWCGPCQHFAPEFEVLILKGEVRAGKVDCQAHYQ
uniref:Thioredoxin domain-containing protein n=1 Tax=Seriola lalandi dorsalis TaxID=1841481 RepID=A0A3B4X8X7_SERLL